GSHRSPVAFGGKRHRLSPEGTQGSNHSNSNPVPLHQHDRRPRKNRSTLLGLPSDTRSGPPLERVVRGWCGKVGRIRLRTEYREWGETGRAPWGEGRGPLPSAGGSPSY